MLRWETFLLWQELLLPGLAFAWHSATQSNILNSSRNAPPKPSSAAPSSVPRPSRTRPEPSPATKIFNEQFPPWGHEPPTCLYPHALWLRGALHIFPSYSTPTGERHAKKANHTPPPFSDNMPTHLLTQSEHTRRASLFMFWLARNARAHTVTCSIDFCTTWVCISSTLNSKRRISTFISL